VLDEEQHVDPLEERSVDMKQVAGDDPFGLRFQELSPRGAAAPWCWAQAGAFEDVAYGAGRYSDSDSGELAADPLIAPCRVLTSNRNTASPMSARVEGRPGRQRETITADGHSPMAV
jgi:hypothetical protein